MGLIELEPTVTWPTGIIYTIPDPWDFKTILVFTTHATLDREKRPVKKQSPSTVIYSEPTSRRVKKGRQKCPISI
mgnify:CR=1 FL=1